jgi:hypothetical protein
LMVLIRKNNWRDGCTTPTLRGGEGYCRMGNAIALREGGER